MAAKQKKAVEAHKEKLKRLKEERRSARETQPDSMKVQVDFD
jgi:hypothetical protein